MSDTLWSVQVTEGDVSGRVAFLLEATPDMASEIGPHDTEDGRRHLVYHCPSYERAEYIRKTLEKEGLDVQMWSKVGRGRYRRWNPRKMKVARRRNQQQKKTQGTGLLFPGSSLEAS